MTGAFQRTRILFVDDDPNILSGLRRMLRGCRDEWQMDFATGGAEALAFAAENEIEVIVSDMKMPDVDGEQLLAEIAEKYPHVIRLVLSGQADKDKIFRVSSVAHQFLSKPCDPKQLQATIRKICDLKESLSRTDLNGIVTRASSVCCLPETYNGLIEAFQFGPDKFDRIKELIAGDIGLALKIMQMVSSSFLGKPNPKSTLIEAVDMLGFDLLSQLFDNSDLFRPLNAEETGHLSLASLFMRARKVASLAAEITRLNGGSHIDVSLARKAGLFHDIGRYVLAQRFPDWFAEVQDLAEGQNETTLREAEREIFGICHYSISSYLLALWGIDQDVVDTVCAFQKLQDTCPEEFSPAAAVYVANRLIDEQGIEAADLPEDLKCVQEIRSLQQTMNWQSLVKECCS